MSIQIAPTPVVKGEDAKLIYQEMQRKPTPKAKQGCETLKAKFERTKSKEGS